MPQPGWYPDPSNENNDTVRWWDGERWTADTRQQDSYEQEPGSSTKVLIFAGVIVAAIIVLILIVAAVRFRSEPAPSTSPVTLPSTSTTPGGETRTTDPSPASATPPGTFAVSGLCAELDETLVVNAISSLIYPSGDTVADVGYTYEVKDTLDAGDADTEWLGVVPGVTVTGGCEIVVTVQESSSKTEESVVIATTEGVDPLIAVYALYAPRIESVPGVEDAFIAWVRLFTPVEAPIAAAIKTGDDSWVLIARGTAVSSSGTDVQAGEELPSLEEISAMQVEAAAKSGKAMEVLIASIAEKIR